MSFILLGLREMKKTIRNQADQERGRRFTLPFYAAERDRDFFQPIKLTGRQCDSQCFRHAGETCDFFDVSSRFFQSLSFIFRE